MKAVDQTASGQTVVRQQRAYAENLARGTGSPY
jgi:hypothetical protein